MRTATCNNAFWSGKLTLYRYEDETKASVMRGCVVGETRIMATSSLQTTKSRSKDITLAPVESNMTHDRRLRPLQIIAMTKLKPSSSGVKSSVHTILLLKSIQLLHVSRSRPRASSCISATLLLHYAHSNTRSLFERVIGRKKPP